MKTLAFIPARSGSKGVVDKNIRLLNGIPLLAYSVYVAQLCQEEGIFVGISAGGTLNAALKIAEHAEPGSVILTMLADTAERYLSTPMFADINEGSDDDWLASL